MIEFIVTVLTNRHLFTVLILFLYCAQVLFNVLVVKDYAWAGYWFSAIGITFFATLLSLRGGQ